MLVYENEHRKTNYNSHQHSDSKGIKILEQNGS